MKKNIVIAEFKHETNRFCPIPADEKAYRARNYLFGQEIFDYFTGVKSEVGGFIDALAGQPDICLLPSVAANATPSGPVTKEVYATVLSTILKTIREADHVDGVLLSLHGAMVSEECEDGEGLLLETIRKEVGPDVPIMGSLDLHVNMTARMQANATAFCVYDFFPHTDMYETGMAIAQIMLGTVRGEIKPVMRWKKLDMIQNILPTETPCIRKYVEEERAMREQPGVLRVNICSGFFHADIEEMGAAVLAVTDGNAELAQSLADQLADAMWEDRENLHKTFYTPDQAIDEVLASAEGEGPFVLADVADNPGAGGSADSTTLLRRLIERDVKNVAVAIICDPESVAAAEKAGVGNTVELDLGGKVCPEINGAPIHVTAYVQSISDGVYYNRDKMGQGLRNELFKTAVLVVGGIQIIVSGNRPQPYDLEVYRSQGIEPKDKKVLMVKSTAHFRASYGKIAYRILDVEAPALAPQSIEQYSFRHCRRPIYPLDPL